MPPLGPIAWRDLIRALQAAGFEGPYPGKRHPFMLRGAQKLILPNPHRSDIGTTLLHNVLKQAGISRDDWEKL
jgi:predicted RNA binding protein YcfA (HicA-like mRNA interferase family)